MVVSEKTKMADLERNIGYLDCYAFVMINMLLSHAKDCGCDSVEMDRLPDGRLRYRFVKNKSVMEEME